MQREWRRISAKEISSYNIICNRIWVPRCVCEFAAAQASLPVRTTGILPVDSKPAAARQDARPTPQGPSRTGVGCLCYKLRSRNFPFDDVAYAHSVVDRKPSPLL